MQSKTLLVRRYSLNLAPLWSGEQDVRGTRTSYCVNLPFLAQAI